MPTQDPSCDEHRGRRPDGHGDADGHGTGRFLGRQKDCLEDGVGGLASDRGGEEGGEEGPNPKPSSLRTGEQPDGQ